MHKSVPTICYKLWKPTQELLKEFWNHSEEGEFADRALVNAHGTPLKTDVLRPDGKPSRTDAIRLAYDRVADDLEIKKPMKLLRKTSASLLDSKFDEKLASHF